MAHTELIQRLYDTLREEFGHQNWWPADSPFEVMVGAILTQNTNWQNVTKAIAQLKQANALSADALVNLESEELQTLIRPAGYYRQKAARLKRLAGWLKEECDGNLNLLAEWPTDALRDQLLALRGIGPETACSILLYALDRPVFVVDTYTHRIVARHDLVWVNCSYEELQALFEDHLPRDTELYRDYHAQLVEVGKRFCKKSNPRCKDCPVRTVLGEPSLEEEF